MSPAEQAAAPGAYAFTAVEAKWQKVWQERRLFAARNPGEGGFDPKQSKAYVLDMFPYPSGAGLHVGHPIGYIATDIYSRYLRMRGHNVLHPMGFDAFGLPAEQHAIETGTHPAITTQTNIDTYRRQLRMFGFSYDWDRELATTDVGYYRWTQWIFLQMFNSWYDEECPVPSAECPVPDAEFSNGWARPIAELIAELERGRRVVDSSWHAVLTGSATGDRPHQDPIRSSHAVAGLGGALNADQPRAWLELSPSDQRRVIDNHRLAYMDEIPVNWCPALGTVLANEEVTNEGRSDRGDHPVYRRPLKQWMLRITAYAERLLADLDGLEWPEPIKRMQRNWIGRSEGATIEFPLAEVVPPASSRQTVAPASSQQADADRMSALQPAGSRRYIAVFTTRPDTVFGATYMVLAPEHPLVADVTTAEQRGAVAAYVAAARNRSDLERTAESKQKTGVFTGADAINPVTGKPIPIWIADYVLMGYGTGAIMAVPASDERDFEFAKAFNLPIVAVVSASEPWIIERVKAMTTGLAKTAEHGLDAVRREFPELGEAIAAHKVRSVDLDGQTAQALLERVGVKQLIEHRNRHPEVWGEAFCDEGIVINSPPPGEQVADEACVLNGLTVDDAKHKIIAWLERTGRGRGDVKYKLRDWIFSRQKYWGEPFPVVHGPDGEVHGLDESELPVELPPMDDFRPKVSDDPNALPEPPLGRAKEWVEVKGRRSGLQAATAVLRTAAHSPGAKIGNRKSEIENAGPFRRDLNTMPQWAGSCWYYLRYLDPHNTQRFCDPAAEKYWMPVDLYVGGAEHAVLHLLYARFWHKVLFDLGHVSTAEPFQRLINQGMVQSFAYEDRRGAIVGWDKVAQADENTFKHAETGEPLKKIVAKMSKSLKNVVNPDEIIAEYGADTFRVYEMFMGPIETSKPWNTRDVPGPHKLLHRIWRLMVDEQTGGLSPAFVDEPADAETLRLLHKTIRKVGGDLEAFKFNTAIAAIFDFVNGMTAKPKRPRSVIEPFILLLAPFAPHIAEELWQRVGHGESLAYHPWPTFDPALATDALIEIPVQINGKKKTVLLLPPDADEAATEAAVRADAKLSTELAGKTINKLIIVKGRLVNIVTAKPRG